MNRNALLLAAGNSGAAAGPIGVAGEQGYGVGVCDNADDLAAMSLTPMDGCDDPASANYGNYVHSNGSVMVFVPAFCYRIGRPTAPSYERDGANALETGAPELDGTDGWVLHRAFIDGGQNKSGFFLDKYINSKSSSNSGISVSVKNGDPISLCNNKTYNYSYVMPGCSGILSDAITLSRGRGDTYSCATIFQWSAIAMLSMAHGQAATSSEFCAWYDSAHSINFPKGANNFQNDVNDSLVSFTSSSYGSNYSKAGSGKPFAKTTHNGQPSGICDLSGNKYQVLIAGNAGYTYKESLAVHAINTSNYGTTGNYDAVSGISVAGSGYWGNGTNQAFFTEYSGSGRALCGVYAKKDATGGSALFGNDNHNVNLILSQAVLASGNYSAGFAAGVFSRYVKSWTASDYHCGFRAAGYPPSVAPWGGGN